MTENPNETPAVVPPPAPPPAPSPAAPLLPHTTEKTSDDAAPPLYISGFGVMGQSSPDVATGSTPVTRKDD